MIEPGTHEILGATWDGGGVNFAVFSENAEAVELCLFDANGHQSTRVSLPENTDGVWHGFVPGCEPGQRYGYRARGRYDPTAGLLFNPNKLLLDPYAREWSGSVRWAPELFGYTDADDRSTPSRSDSAPFVPKAIVQPHAERPPPHVRVPWEETILYETHVRGYTMRHSAVPESDRGLFRGMRNADVLEYLKALGVTSIELMPVQAFVDEHFLSERGLRNYWGYNTLGFFAPEPRYLGGGGIGEFRDMVNALHDAGLEVILDVVYNHTAEGSGRGPTLSFRGIDNLAYYRLHPDDLTEYVNDTGCGNTINVDHPRVRQLILDSLRYWITEMGVDGFRFDLAPVLGRTSTGFDPEHAFFRHVQRDPVVSAAKLIAEPWDVGPEGYQLGRFPPPWAEWTDRFRDTVRQFWRGDKHTLGEFAGRYLGSAHTFEPSGRAPWASINFAASHDGFTTADIVSYEHRHNHTNGEANQDGHEHNYSCNYGVEGPTNDPTINATRRRQSLNLLATALLSQGTPMLLAGDEFRNSQSGNNNAYAQDNEIGWLDWSGTIEDPEFQDQVRTLTRLRRNVGLLRRDSYLHGERRNVRGYRDIEWLGLDGKRLADDRWSDSQAITVLLCDTREGPFATDDIQAVAVTINASKTSMSCRLPRITGTAYWYEAFSSGGALEQKPRRRSWEIPARACCCFVLTGSPPDHIIGRRSGIARQWLSGLSRLFSR